VLELADQVHNTLRDAGIRVRLDAREDQTPGFKFNDWEMRGVPVRVEIGPRDVKSNCVLLARRDRPGREGKQFGIQVSGIVPEVNSLLEDVQQSLLAEATNFREANIRPVADYAQFKSVLKDQGGFLRVYWAGSREDEDRIQEETKATLRCLPMDCPDDEGECFYTGKRTNRIAIFARAY